MQKSTYQCLQNRVSYALLLESRSITSTVVSSKTSTANKNRMGSKEGESDDYDTLMKSLLAKEDTGTSKGHKVSCSTHCS